MLVISLCALLSLLGLLLLAVGTVLGLYGRRHRRLASLLGHPLNRIAKLQPGFRKVRGKVVPLAKTLRSPVSNEECVYYRLRVDEDTSGSRSPFENEGALLLTSFLGGILGSLAYKSAVAIGESAPSEYTVLEEVKSIPLAIEDETGKVEVDLCRATVLCKKKSRIRTDMLHPVVAVARLTDKLREEYGFHSVDARGFSKKLQFVEEVLPAGTKVTVMGSVGVVDAGDLCFQGNGDALLVSERDMGKEGRAVRGRAINFFVGSSCALVVGLGCLLGTVAFLVHALLAHR